MQSEESVSRSPNLNQIIVQLTFDAASWYKAVVLQLHRFEKATEQDRRSPFELPWKDTDGYPFLPEKLHLITAVFHALDTIKSLNDLLLEVGDSRLVDIFTELCQGQFYNEIKLLRNANEHSIDYYRNKGHKQECFGGIISTEIGNVHTNAHMYYHIGRGAFLGTIRLNEILEKFCGNHESVVSLLRQIHLDYILKG